MRLRFKAGYCLLPYGRGRQRSLRYPHGGQKIVQRLERIILLFYVTSDG